MSRELKFRIWDSDQGRVLPVIVMRYDAEGRQWFGFQRSEAGQEPASMEYCEAHHGDPTVAVMQFTGLHDKNRREIYEGDILRCDHFVDVVDGQQYLTHYIEWDDRASGWTTRNSDGGVDGSPPLWVYMRNAENPEVIGNIHENPELLA